MFSRLYIPSKNLVQATAVIIEKALFRRVAYFGSAPVSLDGTLLSAKESFEEVGVQFITSLVHEQNQNISIEQMYEEIDAALDKLSKVDARVIVYGSRHRDSKFVAWRAWKKNLLGIQPTGEVYQWLFFIDANRNYLFDDDCIVQECIDDMHKVREALYGSFVTSHGLTMNEEWFNEEWVPNTTLDKLNPADVLFSESNDWAADWQTRFGVMYDLPLLMTEAVKNMCEDQSDATFDECIRNLPNMGEELVKYIRIAEVENGATGHVILDENGDRKIPVRIGQWTKDGIEYIGEWNSVEGYITVSDSLNTFSSEYFLGQTAMDVTCFCENGDDIIQSRATKTYYGEYVSMGHSVSCCLYLKAENVRRIS
eukprot:TRINITY_DN2954_c0_g1_i2.p1 TRINITY_DN2954_c0_g1~~TRINITY_DN2954_c0_g1_i2.p1  ORF type:complete len:368 (-),score=94.81 TRINITY_DN2954_c0_g1_i2:85-1188(-)